MSSTVNIVVSERQWEELKGLMGTINQGPISSGDTAYPPKTCMITSLRLERVGSGDAYHVELHLNTPPKSHHSEPLVLARWPGWLERSVQERRDTVAGLGANPAGMTGLGIARLFT